MYDHISIPLLSSSYLKEMEAVKPAIRLLKANHLVELMGDAELYGWELVHVFNVVWLQQLEHSRVTWADEDARCALVTH